MDTHAPVHLPGQEQASLPNQPFFSWLRTQTTLFVSQIIALFTLVYFLISLVYYAIGTGEHGGFLFSPSNIKLYVDYAHIVFIAVFILVLIQVLDDNDRGAYRVNLVYERVFGHRRRLSEKEHDEKLASSKEQTEKVQADVFVVLDFDACVVCHLHHPAYFRPRCSPAGNSVG